jgi:hypothetical protein
VDNDANERKIAKCIDDMHQWASENNYLDVLLPCCLCVVASYPMTEKDINLDEHRTFFLSYSGKGPALICLDYDVTPFLKFCDTSGIKEVYYNEPIFVKKGVDNKDEEGHTSPNKPTIH